nr:fasciclin domain-containing protein [Conyzicola lurida]
MAAALSVVALAGCSTSAPEPDASSATPTADATSGLVGAGCADYIETNPDGAGSIAEMAQESVYDAASNNPLLTTLVEAVSGEINPGVNLVDALDGTEYTIFAPVDSAFADLAPETLALYADPANAAMFGGVLSYHAISGQIEPDDLPGEHTTVEGSPVTITGSGDDLMVNEASVVCGGIHTATATLYLIDTVLTPPAS